MEEITALFDVNYIELIVSVFTILIGIKAVTSIFEWVIEKFGIETKWMRNKREEHELLMRTSENLSELQKKHQEDVAQSIAHDKKIQEDLSLFMDEMRKSTLETKDKIEQFANNRVHDRQQSLQIQKDLTDSIKSIYENDKNRESQINSLTIANRELLAGKINDKYKYFVSIDGIPEDEVDEFTSLHQAYNACGGNHHGDAKYDYVMKHLSVIPVETKLVYKEK